MFIGGIFPYRFDIFGGLWWSAFLWVRHDFLIQTHWTPLHEMFLEFFPENEWDTASLTSSP